jgi:hypothetical protein
MRNDRYPIKMLVLVVLIALVQCELPFDDTPDTPLPSPSPSPTPEPQILPYSHFLGIREFVAASLLLLYIIFYIFGTRSVHQSVAALSSTCATPLRRYFCVVPDRLSRVSRHEYRSWITGRSGYHGGFVTFRLTRRSDPIGFIFDRILQKKTMLTFELVCEPANDVPAIFSLSNRPLDYVKEYKLKARKVEGLPLTLFTDFGASRHPFVDKVIAFNSKRPGAIVGIDLSDTNRFATRNAGRFVARFEFAVRGDLARFVDDEMVDCVMDVADSFCKLQLTEHAFEKNARRRQELFGPQNPEKKKNV